MLTYYRYQLIGVTLITMLATACTSRYYVPNQHNVPLFHEKGDLRLSAGASGGDDVSGIEVQGAYAVTKQLGVIGNLFVARSGSNSGSHGYFLEGGPGYFRTLSRRVAFETYGGAGVGRAVNQYGSDNSSDLRFSRYFIQPDIGFRGRIVEAAVSLRTAGLHYSSIRTSFATAPATNDAVEYIRQHPSSLLIEPAYIFRVGWKYVKAQFQLSSSYDVTAPLLQQEKLMFSYGVYFSKRVR